MKCAAVCCVLFLAAAVRARRPVKEYIIDLDKAPEDRYTAIIGDTSNGFNTTVWGFYNKYFANDKAVMDALDVIADARALTEDKEMMGEIRGYAAESKLPLNFVHGIQLLYELQTLMLPIVNYTQPPMPKGFEALARIPWRGPGCTGIIATCADGTVSHARNLDFSPVPVMTHLVFTGIFQKGGVEIFRSQMVAGYTPIVTGMRMGKNGYAIERNTRYPDHKDGNEEMFQNVLDGRKVNGWVLRKIMEAQSEYEGAIDAIRAAPYVSTEYAIVSGVKKGIIISRDPDSVAYEQVLGQPGGNFDEREDYIIMTNFDFFHHDVREYFDPTGGQVGYPRRVAAQKMLNATAIHTLTPEYLFETINAKGVIADTIFQAVINVELGVWNVSQPDL